MFSSLADSRTEFSWSVLFASGLRTVGQSLVGVFSSLEGRSLVGVFSSQLKCSVRQHIWLWQL